MATIAKPILKIREVIKDIKFDARKERVPQAVLKRFIKCVENVSDVRMAGKVMYPLPYELLLAFLAVLASAETWPEIESFSESYKKMLNGILPKYKHIGVPAHDTFERVLGLIAPEELQKATAAYLVSELTEIKKALGIKEEGMRQFCFDGKEQKGSGRKYNTDKKIKNLQTLHCYDASNEICLASVPIDEKTNEIPTAQDLLTQMQLKNCIVTFDALNTQKDTVKIIIANKGDYVGGLKGNHHTFYDEVVLFFSEDELNAIQGKSNIPSSKKQGNYFRSTIEKAHNRIEKRTYYMTTDIKWFADLSLWAGLKSFICYIIETEDLVYPQAKTFAKIFT